ncbi:putative nuclear RNA export factor SDE5 [Silene latifolia]|uniref:putative nuclear RNA export factor SDE5 n=1 Tax=Silene latifolia TaxID=37657 RepID=UPI003D7761D6
METVSSCSSSMGDRSRDMEMLTEAFGSSLSLEAIASAYSQAGLNVEMAGLILYELQNEVGVSEGECVISTLSQDESLRSESSRESVNVLGSAVVKDDDIHEDIGTFLFQMLGDGFQLDMEKINEVLGTCGYDLEKSMETLVDISASTLEKSDDVVCDSASAESESYQDIGPYYCYEKSPLTDDPGPRLLKQNTKDQRKKNKNNSNLQAEILGALFTAPERVEQRQSKRIIPRARVRKSVLYGRSVVVPPKETNIEQTFVAVKSLADGKEDEDGDENSFPVLRQAVREHWVTMKEYYKAAIDAYTKGDKERAGKLMKEGQFFNKLAREADEKSVNKLIESRPDEEMLLDFSTFEPREAVKLLRLHLSNLGGIPGIRYLKVGVQNADGQNKKGSLKRLVLKLLEKEAIECTETDDGKTIVIRLDEINPQALSFAKKKEVKLPDV